MTPLTFDNIDVEGTIKTVRLTALRGYVFAHTTSRIDVELGPAVSPFAESADGLF